MIDPHAGYTVELHERKVAPKADPVPKILGIAILVWVSMAAVVWRFL